MLNIIWDLGGDQPEDSLNLDSSFISSARFKLDSSSLGISSFTDYWVKQTHEDQQPYVHTQTYVKWQKSSPFILQDFKKLWFSPACNPHTYIPSHQSQEKGFPLPITGRELQWDNYLGNRIKSLLFSAQTHFLFRWAQAPRQLHCRFCLQPAFSESSAQFLSCCFSRIAAWFKGRSES